MTVSGIVPESWHLRKGGDGGYAAQNGSLSFNVLRGVNSIQPNWNTTFDRNNIDKVREAVASAFKWVIP